MMDFAAVPENVKKLATSCFLQNIGPSGLLKLAREEASLVAKEAGLDILQYIEALEWLGEYNRAHAEALRRYCESRGRAHRMRAIRLRLVSSEERSDE